MIQEYQHTIQEKHYMLPAPDSEVHLPTTTVSFLFYFLDQTLGIHSLIKHITCKSFY